MTQRNIDQAHKHRPDYIHCIAAEPGRSGTTLCGLARWSFDWVFVDAEHARATVAGGHRLVPCSDCWAAAGEEPLP
jgi:hypothetical protein